MRLVSLAALVLLVGCGPGVDQLVGTYNFALTGLDTNSAPNMNTSTPAGTGTISITPAATMTSPASYIITLAQSDTTPCIFAGTSGEKAAAPEIVIKGDTKCTFASPSGSATATISSGKAVLTLNATRPADVMTLDLSYTYAGTVFGFAFAGSGHRNYAGLRR